MRTHTLALALFAALVTFPAVSEAQRLSPPLNAAGPFTLGAPESTVTGLTQILTLTGPNYVGQPKPFDDLLFYNATTGQAWIIVNLGSLYGQTSQSRNTSVAQFECIVFVQLEPGLTLTATHIDEDRLTDILGYRPTDGRIFRYYRRGFPGC